VSRGPGRPHSSPFCRWRHFDRHRRRCEHAELKALLGQPNPAPPSTFSLEPDERCAHARELRSSGWSAGEVARVLVVDDPACREDGPDG
jgi:hypothetical protein